MVRHKAPGGSRSGVIAAGHSETAAAGQRILESGGNAVDAAIAAAFTACVCEPCLIALGAGGFMLVHDSENDQENLLDFFVGMPGQGLDDLDRPLSKLVPTPVDFGETVQMFHSGHASNGVPGFVAGMFKAHERYASLPMKELMAPARALALGGVVINRQQDVLFELLYKILWLTRDSKLIFSQDGQRLTEGDTFKYPEMAETLDELLKEGAEGFYRGELAAAIVAESDAGGGRITAEDLASYEVIDRVPVRTKYRGAEIVGNPPPSSGGPLIAHSLNLLSQFDLAGMGWLSADHIRHIVEAQISTNQVRKVRFDEHRTEEDALDKLLAEEQLAEDLTQVQNRLGHGNSSSRLGNTTHISVIDGDGMAVSMTNSNGACSGIQVPGTGIQLNSMLGEEDLNPDGFHRHPVGSRIPSMMSPTLVLEDSRPRLAVGSAGSNRIRSAVLETIVAMLDFGKPIKQAVEAPRIHVEGETVEIEHGIPEAVSAQLKKDGYQTNLWADKNLFFGGAHSVERDPKTGKLTGHGDSRRGGAVAETGPVS